MTDQIAAAHAQETSFAGRIALPYTLTAGRAAGVFLAELTNRRIVGSRCAECSRVLVPAQDFCAPCGAEQLELVEVPPTGSLIGFTQTAAGVLALVKLDGTDGPLTHRVLEASLGDLTIGQRVSARWAETRQGSVLDIAGFVPSAGADAGEVRPLASDAAPIAEMPYRLELNYRHAYGPYYGRLFDELGSSRRILGTRCPSCESVLVPPREYCDVCYVRTDEWVDVPDTGVVQAFSIIHLEFVGQMREPPYIYSEIMLDGSATRLIHEIGGIDPDEARESLEPGMRVRARWKEGVEPTGTLADIECFELIGEDD